MQLQLLIMLKPPKGAPDKDDELGAVFPHALKLTDGCRVIVRGPPVSALFFEKGQNVLSPQRCPYLLFVHENDAGRGWDEFLDFFARPVQSGNLCVLLVPAKFKPGRFGQKK